MPRKILTEADREQARLYGRWWYRQNAKKVVVQKDARRDELRKWFEVYKSSLVCERCGEAHPATLDFHHLDPKHKEISIAQAIHNGWSVERVLEEIAKCQVLCANCHTRVHLGKK